MIDLPDEVLANILAKVPFGKDKVGMQAVDTQWCRVLGQRAAHSVETFEEDAWFPKNFQHLQEGETRISARFVSALAACKIHLNEKSMAWLPLHLEALGARGHSNRAWVECPSLTGLQKLVIDGDYMIIAESFVMPSFSTLFPNLEVVSAVLASLAWHTPDPDEYIFEESEEILLREVRKLPNLRTLKVKCLRDESLSDWGFDYRGHSPCRISYEVEVRPVQERLHSEESDDSSSDRNWEGRYSLGNVSTQLIRNGLACHLADFTFVLCTVGVDVVGPLNLAMFQECKVLEKVTCTMSRPSEKFSVVGLQHLPQCCSHVIIRWEQDFVLGLYDDVRNAEYESHVPLIQPAEGWQVHLSLGERMLKVSRVSV